LYRRCVRCDTAQPRYGQDVSYARRERRTNLLRAPQLGSELGVLKIGLCSPCRKRIWYRDVVEYIAMTALLIGSLHWLDPSYALDGFLYAGGFGVIMLAGLVHPAFVPFPKEVRVEAFRDQALALAASHSLDVSELCISSAHDVAV